MLLKVHINTFIIHSLFGCKDNGISIIQPSYIPWLGYLYMVRKSDIFVYYDNVQYDKGGWRNRNKVVCGDKVKWLSLSLDMNIDLQKDIYLR